MKVAFQLEVYLYDYRGAETQFCEAVTLVHEVDMSFVPQVGMDVRIGRNIDGPSEHEVEHVTWAEKIDTLYVHLQNYETGIDDNETDADGWEYFDGLIKDYIEIDGWKVIYHRGVRENSKWGKRIQ